MPACPVPLPPPPRGGSLYKAGQSARCAALRTHTALRKHRMRARSSARCAPSRFASRCSRGSPGARKARLQTGNCEPKRALRTPFPGPGNMAGSEPNVREAAAKEKSSQRVESTPRDRSPPLRNRASATGDRRRRPGPHVRLDNLDRATGRRGNDLLGGGLASGTGLHACAVQLAHHRQDVERRSGNWHFQYPTKLESLCVCHG
jgi:hypothetical protein